MAAFANSTPVKTLDVLPAEASDDARALLGATLKSMMGGESMVLLGPLTSGKSSIVDRWLRSCFAHGKSDAPDAARVRAAFRDAWVWLDVNSNARLRLVVAMYAKATADDGFRPQLLLTTELVPDAETLTLLHAAKVRVVALPGLI